jgi:GR25 family glycosyltransferase involved in LPS biosynthesis
MYEFFEDIVCINLDISVKRRVQAQEYFKKLNIPARFYTVQKHVNGGRYGCFDSHIKIIQNAYERGLNNVLVFEDDFVPTPSFSENKIHEAIHFMRKNNDWDVFYFGYGIIKLENNGFTMSSIMDAKADSIHIVQYNPFLTQCLCYSRRAMHKLLNNYALYIDTYHIDVCIATSMNFKNYCIVPLLFDQTFDTDYNIEPKNAFEVFTRTLYPVYSMTKINFIISYFKYILNTYSLRFKTYYIYLLTIVVSLCIWIVYIRLLA